MSAKTLELPIDHLAIIPDNIRADRLIDCPECMAQAGTPCHGQPEGIHHFGRRLRRIILLGVLASERSA